MLLTEALAVFVKFWSRKHSKSKKGFTLLEIIVVFSIIAIVVVVSFVNFRSARVTANETGAQTALNTLRQAMEQYRIIFTGYPITLGALSSSNPPFCDTALTSGSRQGYNFALSNVTQATYTITASPQQVNVTGNRSFQITEAGEIVNV